MTPPYRVVYSGAVRANVKRLLEEAVRQEPEFGSRALAAARSIDERLRADAGNLGEACFPLRQLGLPVRLAATLPLAVTYAVHQQQAIVFVTRFDLMSGPPPAA